MTDLLLRNIECQYGSKRVIENFSFEFKSGKITSILGPNGSGKSTLLKSILRMMPLSKGSISLFDKDIRSYTHQEFARNLAYVPQAVGEMPDFSVTDVVMMGRYPYSTFFRSDVNPVLLDQVMQQTGCNHLRDKKCNELSGGELQKVIIAKALMQQPKFLLLDEPTSNLDITSIIAVGNIIKSISEGMGVGVVLVSHDINFLAALSDEILLLAGGIIQGYGAPDIVLNDDNLMRLFRADIEELRAYTSFGKYKLYS
ncbi:MAG: ABC transporter ATP-binding protein [Candidatus Margulisiibacteriota bacterium]|nr:MAG: hypothetical protein A2X43_13420 [Candidatus Margulisbacteria bacterium GWD2_39_127]OGI04743.1 MAG: hypothetical protein A2X42_10575 [Candidatus Margulisbacteria bacterium GWF2_38_17]OGI05688.1 MAG: hypothetical protein A2X41_03160 [Candidatus Margulisbacteria bacterium GWE2_39_32]PZM83622.1 MAG: ABC transporter ATP-binding protein [Candidatus Margulisiibacteriota bacterium]HAR62040.1 ABC transporter ATP-binding protein [Candidatus Margulisiibacteriota bacterium]